MTTKVTIHPKKTDATKTDEQNEHQSKNILVRSYHNVKNYIYDCLLNDEDDLVLRPEYKENIFGKLLLKYENMSFMKLIGINCGLGLLLGVTGGFKETTSLQEKHMTLWKGAVVLNGAGLITGILLDVISESFIIGRTIMTYDPKTTSRFKSRSKVITLIPLFVFLPNFNSDMKQVVGWFV